MSTYSVVPLLVSPLCVPIHPSFQALVRGILQHPAVLCRGAFVKLCFLFVCLFFTVHILKK